ncbi:MAG TPA: hypothetical protein VF989_02825 [Polyangiaceae bacterium]
MKRRLRAPEPRREQLHIFFHPDDVYAQGIEWIGGVICLDTYDEGPFNEWFLYGWVRTDGELLGAGAIRAIHGGDAVIGHLGETALKPACGLAQAPSRVRVATEPGAELLRAALGHAIDIVVAPTPELDRISQAVLDACGGPAADIHGPPSLSEAAFQIRAKSVWTFLPPDQPILVHIPELGVVNYALIAWEDPFGPSLRLFGSERQARWFVHEATRDFAGPAARGVPHLALRFNRCEVIPPGLREPLEVVSNDSDLVPWLVATRPDAELCRPDFVEHIVLRATLFTLAAALDPFSTVELENRVDRVLCRADFRLETGHRIRVGLSMPSEPLLRSGRVARETDLGEGDFF